MEETRTVSRILGLSEIEKEEIENNHIEYEEMVSELLEVYAEYSRLLGEKLKLDSTYASYNYKIYESFMEVHKNAIILSALSSEIKMKKIDLGEEAVSRVSRILDRYLMLERFE